MTRPNTITEHVDGFRRELTILPAYDKRHPDPKKNFGIHGVDMRFVLVGTAGATQWVLFTGMDLPHVAQEMLSKPPLNRLMAADLGYHALKPQYEGQTAMENCHVLEGGKCFYDGSSLMAEELLEPFLSKGPDAVWERLREEYRRLFEVES